MPAYRQRVYICPNQSGQPGWIMEFPPWWDQREFFQKYGDRQLHQVTPADCRSTGALHQQKHPSNNWINFLLKTESGL